VWFFISIKKCPGRSFRGKYASGARISRLGRTGSFFLSREEKKEKYAVKSLEHRYTVEFPGFNFCQRKIFVYAHFFLLAHLRDLNDGHPPLRTTNYGVKY